MRLFFSQLLLCSLLLLSACNQNEPIKNSENITETTNHYFTNTFTVRDLMLDTTHWNAMPTGVAMSPIIEEASGIIPSVSNDSCYWTHNDSGGLARIFLYSGNGNQIGTLNFSGIGVKDLEDIALLKQPHGTAKIFVGDIGDNHVSRSTIKFIEINDQKLTEATTEADSVKVIQVAYPKNANGISRKDNAEAFFVDPISKSIYLFTKNTAHTDVFKLSPPFHYSSIDTLQYIGSLIVLGQKMTAADIATDGTLFVVKSYDYIFCWNRDTTLSIDSVLQQKPFMLPYRGEVKGEGFCFGLDKKSYVTISEKDSGINPKFYFYNAKP